MSSHPGTYKGEPVDSSGVDWNDGAELHLREDGGGLMSSFKAIRRGTLAELVDVVMDFPESDQGRYAIQKAGDRRLEIGEIRALFRRDDFPGRQT